VVVAPVGEDVVKSLKGRDSEVLLGESWKALGLEGAEGLSTFVKYDFSPTGKPPRQPEVKDGVLFVGSEYLAIVSFSLGLSMCG
jgi:hypothetical protein